MVRKEIYQRIVEQLRTALGGEIKHIDLWNHNVEFIEQEQQWSRPAVFVEFGAINCSDLADTPMQCVAKVQCHSTSLLIGWVARHWVRTQTTLQPSSCLSAFAPLLEGYEVNTSAVWSLSQPTPTTTTKNCSRTSMYIGSWGK